jgi:hypothetical protein
MGRIINKTVKVKEFEKIFSYIFVISISTILILVAVIRPPEFDPDYINYFYTLTTPIEYADFADFEPIYWLIVYFNQILFDAKSSTFFLIFALIYVCVSLFAIFKYSKNHTLSFLIFLLLLYPNFGLIQIRQGIAIAILWFAVHDLLNNRIFNFFIKIFIATLFHYSSLIFIFLIFFKSKGINIKIYMVLPIISLLISKFVLNLEFFKFVSDYLPEFLKFKVVSYIAIVESGIESSLTKINIINAKSTLYTILYYFGLYINQKYKLGKEVNFYLKIFGLGIFSWFALSNVPVFSFRFSEAFWSILAFLIPALWNNFSSYLKVIIYLITIYVLILLSYNIYIRHDLFYWEAWEI